MGEINSNEKNQAQLMYYIGDVDTWSPSNHKCIEMREFIREFRQLCGREWHLCMETSLNVPGDFLPPLVKDLDFFIVDIKDMNPEIYRAYTGKDNAKVVENLRMIATAGRADDCTIRIPLIPGYNTDEDRYRSIAALKELGFSKFDKFTYRYGKR